MWLIFCPTRELSIILKDEWKIVPKNAQENADYLTAAIQLGVTGGFMIDLSDELSEGDFVDSNGIAPTWTNWEPGDNTKKYFDGKDCVARFYLIETKLGTGFEFKLTPVCGIHRTSTGIETCHIFVSKVSC